MITVRRVALGAVTSGQRTQSITIRSLVSDSRPQRTCLRARFSDRTSLELETDSHLDLEGRRTILADRAANSLDLEPIDVAQGLTRLAQRIVDRFEDALVGHANHFDDFVGLVRHKTPFHGIFIAHGPVTPSQARWQAIYLLAICGDRSMSGPRDR